MQEENSIIQSPCFFELADKFVTPSRVKLGLKDWARYGLFTYTIQQTVSCAKNRIDPVREDCVVQHFQMSHDTIFTNVCLIV
jgi:hypothetical protein